MDKAPSVHTKTAVCMKRKQKDVEAAHQAALLVLLSKYGAVTIRRSRKRSRLTLQLFHVSRVEFEHEVFDIELFVDQRFSELMGSTSLEKEEFHSKVYIKNRLEFNILVDVLFIFNNIVITKTRKRRPMFGEGKDKLVHIIRDNGQVLDKDVIEKVGVTAIRTIMSEMHSESFVLPRDPNKFDSILQTVLAESSGQSS